MDAFIPMKSFSGRFLKILLIVLSSTIVLAFITARITSAYLEKVISRKLTEVNCKIDSLDVHLLSRSIRGKNLRWTTREDSAHRVPHQIQVDHISIEYIGALRYLFSHELHISKITVEDGAITYNQALQIKDNLKVRDGNFNAIHINQLVLSNLKVHFIADTIPEYSASIDVKLNTILIKNDPEEEGVQYEVGAVEGIFKHLVFQGKSSLYNTTISRVYINSTDGKIDIDSIHMNPLKGKYEFANSLGKQKTRVVLQIPSIRMTGFAFDALRDSIFSVSTTEIREANLSVFRDKRLPFKNPLIPLPMQMLKEEIPFALKLDTIRVINSRIVHEEIAEGGNEIGKVNITALNATISNFNNRLYNDRPPFAVITARSKFMKTGLIEASFFMPVKPGVNYEAIGKISHLNLQEINTITEAVGFLRIESGLMNNLNFNFQYNEYKSNGKLDINYENLKMVSLNKKSKNKINQFKTFILNALVKKNKDKNTPKEERTGVINIERDRRRFVVNVWVMSLFDGLKSAVLPDTQEEQSKK